MKNRPVIILRSIQIGLICLLAFGWFNLTWAKSNSHLDPLGQTFPLISAQSLDKKQWKLPQDLLGQYSILLIGYKQKSQFDIDRWLLGFDMRGVTAHIFEMPVISGIAPRFFSGKIDSGMRSGIPESLWNIVITVYKDSGKVVDFLGNDSPLNARALLLDPQGKVIYFHDLGFSVNALNRLLDVLPNHLKQSEEPCAQQGDLKSAH